MQTTSTQQQRAWQGGLVLVLALAWGLAWNVPQSAILSVMNTDTLMTLYFLLEHIPGEVGFLVAAFLLLSASIGRQATWRDMGFVRFPWWSLILVVVSEGVILGGNILWQRDLVFLAHVPPPLPDMAFADWYTHAPMTFFTQVVIYILIAPCSEEVLFRGFFFRWLADRYGLVTGVVISSLVFALVHHDLFGFVSTLLFAVCSALLLRSTRSLWPGIILHTTTNLLYVLMSSGVIHV